MKRIFLVISIFFAINSPAFCSDGGVSPVSTSEPQQMLDFNLVGYGPQGSKTWEVKGASMDIVDNEIKISDITANLYGAKEGMVLTADKGLLDKQTGVLHLVDNVKAITDTGTQLKTDTLDWSQKEQLITTQDKVNVTKDNIMAVGTGIEAKPDFKTARFDKDVELTVEPQETEKKSSEMSIFESGKIVITCDGPMELNYDKQYAIFYKNVKVEGDGGQGTTMISDKMTVRFDQKSKQLDRMVAEGNVKLVKGGSTSFSDSAVFTASDKKVILTGRPKLVLYMENGKS